MSIGSLCSAPAVTIGETTSLIEAAQVMLREHVGSLVVVKASNGKQLVCGMITDRDLALALAGSLNPQTTQVKQVMRSHPTTIRGTDGIYETVLKMKDAGVKRLPVVDDFGALVGIVSADDLIGLLARELSSLSKITDVQIAKEQGHHLIT